MFKTIFTVTKTVCESVIYAAHFEDFEDAKKFAEREVKRVVKEYSFTKRNYLDGSFLYNWDMGNVEINLDDNAWITDFRFNGIGFYDESGLQVGDFDSMESLRAYFKRSQEIALM